MTRVNWIPATREAIEKEFGLDARWETIWAVPVKNGPIPTHDVIPAFLLSDDFGFAPYLKRDFLVETIQYGERQLPDFAHIARRVNPSPPEETIEK